MSTNDVPGYKAENRDALAANCWAEHEDKSLILIESTEDDRVIFLIFDMAKNPPIEWRDSMAIGAFKKQFSWEASKPKSEKWTWHDKTTFPWDRIIKAGGRDGVKHVSVDDQLSAAERVRRSRDLHTGRTVDPVEAQTRVDKLGEKANKIIKRLQKAVSELGRGD